MNLAIADIRSNVRRFVATSVGVGLLFTVVLSMAGIYGGLVDDATMLERSSSAPLWVVQRDSRGPFADQSRLDPSIIARVWAVPGVARARGITYQVVQRLASNHELRFALVGLDWPEDDGRAFDIVAGHALDQGKGQLVVDASLGLAVGTPISLAGEEFRVIGLLHQMLGPGGEPVVLATLKDAQLICDYAAPDARAMERERRVERLRDTELASMTPAIEGLLIDPSWSPPALPNSSINAVLVNLFDDMSPADVRARLSHWEDVSVLTHQEQQQILLDGSVDKPKRQLALFSVILIVTSSILIAALIYTTTLDKLHDIAMLKLLGASSTRIAGMVLQQAWLMGVLGYALAITIGHFAFPHFPRRIVLSDSAFVGVAALVVVVSTLASLVAVRFALRVDPAKALEA
jgi:putative ABC transport system permease protein